MNSRSKWSNSRPDPTPVPPRYYSCSKNPLIIMHGTQALRAGPKCERQTLLSANPQAANLADL